VIGLVGAATGQPLAMGERDEDLGLVDTDRAGDLATQRQAVLDHEVVPGLVEFEWRSPA
jgi:hypothetical protein